MGLFKRKPKKWKSGREVIVPRPEPTGIYGTQKLIQSDAELAGLGLLGHAWGEGIPVLESIETGSVLRIKGENSITLWGPQGGGKFTDVQGRAVIEAGATRSQIIIDASGGQILATTGAALRQHARVVAFCPSTEALPDGVAEILGTSRSYNAMDSLDPKSELYWVHSDALAEMLIAEKISNGTANEGGFFIGRARAVTSGVIGFLREHGNAEDRNMPQVARIVLTRRIHALARDVMKRSDISPYVKDRLGPMAAPGAELDRTINAVLQTADEGLSMLSNAAVSSVSRISSLQPEDLKWGPRPTVLFITMPISMIRECVGWFGLILSSFLRALTSTPRGRWPVQVVCDETGILPRQPVLEQCYAEGRKKGVQVMSFFQHVGQTLEIYGESGLRNFESGSDVLIYFAPHDLETAQRVSERAGRGTAVVPQYSYGTDAKDRVQRNLSFGEQPFDVLTPQQVMGLGRYRAVMFTRTSSHALLVGRRPWFDTTQAGHRREEHARLRRLIAPDPYHPGKGR